MAFGIAISGLSAAAAALDVAGNNIANSSTTGYKTARAEFVDVFSVSNFGSTADAIGQGVRIAAVEQQFNQGNIAFTNNTLDLALNGPGFFTVEDRSGARSYTRAGSFGADEEGFVVNSAGLRLITFGAQNGTITGAQRTLQLPTTNISPRATTAMQVGVNLDSTEAVPASAFDPVDPLSFNNSTSAAVFDSLGVEHLATLFFRKSATNVWETHLRIDGDPTQTTTPVNLNFDSGGLLTTAMPVSYGTFNPANGATAFTVSFDFSNTTQFVETEFGVNSLSQDGFTTGRLNGIDIDDRGVVLARFTNGQSQAQGQLALANFANPQGLQPIGDTSWIETAASGVPLVGAPGSASLGLVQSGSLEESTTDLAEQLVNVIISQRNFQANAQMIEAEDEITQTVINIR